MSKEEIERIIAAMNHKDRKNKKFVYNYQLANIAMKMGIKKMELCFYSMAPILFV